MVSHKSHKNWIKKKVIWIERKKKTFFLWKKGKFIFLTKKKKEVEWKNKCLLYIDTFLFLEKKEKVVYFKLKYLLPYLQFFFLTLSKNIFGKSVWTIIILKKKKKSHMWRGRFFCWICCCWRVWIVIKLRFLSI